MQLIIIGGGAAGLFAAIAAAEANPRAQVTVLEKNGQPLGKVRISGGGRCNVTHACFDPAELVKFYPRGGAALRGPFTRFQPRDTVAWFSQRGIRLKTESDGRMFPVTDDSQTIVEGLLNAAQSAGVRVVCGAHLSDLAREAVGFTITSGADTYHAERVLLATGSNAQGWAWARALGHTLEPPAPSLFTFNVPDSAWHALAGVSVPEARATLSVGDQTFTQSGPVLITHWGVSGPAVLKLSAWAARALHDHQYQAELRVNWWPALNAPELLRQLAALKAAHPRRKVLGEGVGPLPARLWERLTEIAGIETNRRWADVAKRDVQTLAEAVQRCALPVRGKGVFKDEFVTCGGVRLDEVNFKTMESRRCPGLYFAGEILDIDALTGGFNFQNAWTTGWIAGHAMAR
jgi:hypothetical protein